MIEMQMNGILADKLGELNPRWTVKSETKAIENSNKQLDILVTSYGKQPVVIEAEWDPASTVENDAQSRLGEPLDKTVQGMSVQLEVAIALCIPSSLKELGSAREVISRFSHEPTIRFRYALLTGINSVTFERFPKKGYFLGDIKDLAIFINEAGNSAAALEKSIEKLEQGVKKIVSILRAASVQSDDWKQHLAKSLKQDFKEDENGEQLEQVLGIAATIMINAMMFQQRLAGNRGNSKHLSNAR